MSVEPFLLVGGVLLAGSGFWWIVHHRAQPVPTSRVALHTNEAAQARDFSEKFDQLANPGMILEVHLDEQNSVIQILSSQPA